MEAGFPTTCIDFVPLYAVYRVLASPCSYSIIGLLLAYRWMSLLLSPCAWLPDYHVFFRKKREAKAPPMWRTQKRKSEAMRRADMESTLT
jgi:hypothetical protein